MSRSCPKISKRFDIKIKYPYVLSFNNYFFKILKIISCKCLLSCLCPMIWLSFSRRLRFVFAFVFVSGCVIVLSTWECMQRKLISWEKDGGRIVQRRMTTILQQNSTIVTDRQLTRWGRKQCRSKKLGNSASWQLPPSNVFFAHPYHLQRH